MKNEAASVYTYVSYVTLLWWSWMMALRGEHIRDLILPFIACFSEYMKIIAIFYYPVLFYPLLACSTLQHKAGYVFGTLLSFGHFGILLWQKFDCPKTPEVRRQWHFSILRWERGPSLCARVAALWDFQGIKVLVCWSFKGWITSTFLLTDLQVLRSARESASAGLPRIPLCSVYFAVCEWTEDWRGEASAFRRHTDEAEWNILAVIRVWTTTTSKQLPGCLWCGWRARSMNFNYVKHNHDYCKQLVQNREGLTQRPWADYDDGGDIFFFSTFKHNNTTDFFVFTADLIRLNENQHFSSLNFETCASPWEFHVFLFILVMKDAVAHPLRRAVCFDWSSQFYFSRNESSQDLKLHRMSQRNVLVSLNRGWTRNDQQNWIHDPLVHPVI